ncbi:MAG: NAD(P)/FAD-dependent oxidoreductase [Burkholderiales bacterium]|nr:NAD(P)/FAD-dependent oxidoreductase [Burkholderiales bacterium]
MSKSRYDGVVIGAGHNGLITAAYLARAGLRVAVFESRPNVGGAFSTEELTVPGFKHLIHAIHCKLHDSPVNFDLALERRGVSYLFPEPKKAFIRHDSYFVYHQDVEANVQSIKRISPRDAETYRKVARKWQQWYLDFILPEMYSAPSPPQEWEAWIRNRPGGREYLEVVRGYSPVEYANELFESEFCRLSVIRAVASAEYDPACKGIPALVFSFIVSWFAGKSSLVSGGTRRAAEALAGFVTEHGGEIFEAQRVERILVENGVATGIALSDGREVRAERFVASSIDPVHTFLFMIGEDRLPETIRQKVRDYKFKGTTLLRVHLALREQPVFKISSRDPSINSAWKLTIGFESPGDFLKLGAQASAGRIPEIVGLDGGIISVHDPSQAPPGRHTAYIAIPAPFELADGGAGRWVDVSREAAERMLEKLREYAPNMTPENILGRFAYTPKDIEEYLPDMVSADICQGMICPEQLGYNRPWPGMSRYRTFIDGLYLCGAAAHPGGHATGAPGYNAANAIAEDLGIAKWWPAFEPRKVVTL